MSHPNLPGIQAVRLFSDLTEDDLKRLALIAEKMSFNSGAVMIREGDLGSAMYIITSGTVRVLKRSPHSKDDEEVAEMGRGTYVGLNALIERSERSATILAVEPTSTLRIGFEELREMLDSDSDFALRFWRTAAVGLSRQLRSANRSQSLMRELIHHRISETRAHH
ncbi:MAG: cyclic nucleotide-binding domain-containing protein [Myxococcota bacterium]|nr:cyclic nucleotide-binding domain-containing protein [Myxococcota bacterium]